MKIKHYRAPDMRQALRMVREAQGPDAVILSSRRVNGGVEVVAAVDYDHDGVDAYGHDLHAMSAQAHASQPVERTDRAACTMHEDRSIRSQGVTDSASRARDQGLAIDAIDELERSADLSEELRAMRRMLETQLATLAWNDLSRRSPVQAELLKELTQIGLARDLSAELVAQMPAGIQLAEAQRLALALIARRIAVASERWLDSGGVVAMVGATGVGKTTLIAKLAARWLLQHGPRSIALISTDSIRIGAHEQIHTLGRLLGVPAYAIDGASELAELLDHLSDKRLVLIDTAGYSQRDPRLHEELEMLAAANERLETTLVLSAAAQAGAIEEAVERFAAARPATCVLTKLDEATSLGGSISMLIRSGLPVAYLSDGQRVPEDISPARAHQLVARAVELARKSGATADEDLLRRRFGEVAHALA
ncbi:MAG: flagellar biosynthesis protein FlhF [Gammaproteobacteria bacterium]|nr:flagellar biosynthesis protein FlhF [Gammaproteobacteria bacterium]